MPDAPFAFTTWLAKHREGLTESDLTAALLDVVAAASREGKPATLTFTVKIEPSRGGALLVDDTVAVKLPKPPADPKLYFVAADGSLTRSNPLQPSIPFDPETGEVTR